MAGIGAKWTKLPLPDLPRSSHTLSIIQPSIAILFSGELQPREPVSNELYLADLSSQSSTAGTAAIQTVSPDSTTPSPRIGSNAASTGTEMYVFSGRAGKDFSTSDTTLYVFLAESRTWAAITKPTESEGSWPDARSYHAMAGTSEAVYVHAGCGAAGGRLNDLWRFDVSEKKWAKLADAPGKPRGGTSIVASANGKKLFRLGGFDGKQEIGGSVDVYDVEKDTWESHEYENGPTARSVAGLVSLLVNERESLVYLFGESDPSNLGHAGAGKFLEDVWVYDLGTKHWMKISETGDRPAPRGWHNAVAVREQQILIQGGLGATNERLGDWWTLQLNA